MIGIKQIGSYIPDSFESNYDKREKFNIDDTFIEQKLGVKSVSRKLVEEETSDMCIRAFKALEKKEDISIDSIDCIVVCTQNPDGKGLPHTSAIVQDKLGTKKTNMAVFDIGLGCSGYVYSLSIVKSFMEANNMKNGLLFTADPYSKIINPNDKSTVLLFGDAATVTLLDSVPVLKPESFVFETIGSCHKYIQNRDGYLQMNGREVFNFTALAVTKQVKLLLEKEGLNKEVIDLFCFHQASKYILDTLQKRLGLENKKLLSNIAKQGNTVSSSIPLLLEAILSKKDNKVILICGFGVGLSIASCILKRI